MKEPFKFSYTTPSLDWFETIEVTINSKDYTSFYLEKRYGEPEEWWVIGINIMNEKPYIKRTALGRLSQADTKRFIEWAKMPYGSLITGIESISTSIDLLQFISEYLLS